jgi:hypothetical protein
MKFFTQKAGEPAPTGETPAGDTPPAGTLDRLERIPADLHRLEKSVTRTWRELKELSGLLYHQASLTTEALGHAGWIDPDDASDEKALQKVLAAVATDKPIIGCSPTCGGRTRRRTTSIRSRRFGASSHSSRTIRRGFRAITSWPSSTSASASLTPRRIVA